MSLQHVAMLWNTGVHVIMYYYYFLRARGIDTPNTVWLPRAVAPRCPPVNLSCPFFL